jgi:hypothetical protein
VPSASRIRNQKLAAIANFRLQISESENNSNHTPQIANLKTQNAITNNKSPIKVKMAAITNRKSQIKVKTAAITNRKSQIRKCLLLSTFCFLPSAFCFLLSAFCSSQPVPLAAVSLDQGIGFGWSP